MGITLTDITPVGLCISTQELLDGKRFQQNFCDNVLLRMRDKNLESIVLPVKRELSSSTYQKKFLEGHKTAIVSNIDKIISLSSRYAVFDVRTVENVITEGKEMIKRVLLSESFEKLAELEPVFRSKITLQVYSLFSESLKRQKVV